MKNFIKCFVTLFLFTVLINSLAYSAGESFRSVNSGNWNATSTWQMFNGSIWVPATSTPNAGSGVITIQNLTNVSVTANVDAEQLVIDGGATLTINPGIILTILNGSGDDITLLPGGTINGPGTVQTQGIIVTINLRGGSFFNAPLQVNTGTTAATDFSGPNIGRLYGPVTVDAGATLSVTQSGLSSYKLEFYGNLTNNGTLTSLGATGKTMTFKGSSFVNNGEVTTSHFNLDSTSTLSGAGSFAPYTTMGIGANGNITLLSNVTFSPGDEFIVTSGGILNPNNFTITYTSGGFVLNSGATVVNSGLFKTQNTVYLNLRGGSFFNAPLQVNTGTTAATDYSGANIGRLYGNVTVDAGATLSATQSGLSSYKLEFYGNLTNNGILTSLGASGKTMIFKGSSFMNNGSVTTSHFNLDSTSTLSGAGSFAPYNTMGIGANGNITLLSNVTFSPVDEFIVTSGGILNPNNFIITYTSGGFVLNSGATVVNSGLFKTQNIVYLNLRGGSFFNAPLQVNTATTAATDYSSPNIGRLYGNVTVDAGATLSATQSGLSSYKLEFYGNLTNNGTLTSLGASGKTMTFLGSLFVNNGSITTSIFNLNSISTLSGTGSWSTNANILTGAGVTLTSNHQFRGVNINTGSSFNVGSNTVKFTASNPIVQNGIFLNVGSKIEYNGSALQNISTTNITYAGLRINNSSGTLLLGNVSVNDTLSVIIGDLDLAGKIITLSSAGYLTETPDNTIKGATGYITTTRNVGTPGSLNVGGLGAVLTASSNLGNTEVRRGHGVQTGGSIKRYFDITPANNTGLTATLVFKYDESELNLRPESTLKLLKSTNSGASFTLIGGAVNTTLNQITLSGISSFSRWTADSSGVDAVITMVIEGFYDASTNRLRMQDTVRVYLRNTFSPFAIVDSAKTLLDSATLKAACIFPNAPNGIYYIQTKHRNALETWSRPGGEQYTAGTTINYNFTLDSNMAFGDNMKKVGTKWTLFSGDVNQNGIINLADILQVSNAASTFASGYVVTDVSGDRVTNLTDIIFTFNNSNLFVTKETP